MDFSPTEAQQDLAALTRRILGDHVTPESLGAHGSGGYDAPLWIVLAKAGVLDAALPSAVGGGGFGLLEQCSVLTEVGRHGAITPALATLGFGVIPLLDLASDEQQDRFLGGAAKGGLLTAALNEPGAALPDRPATTFANGKLSGTMAFMRGKLKVTGKVMLAQKMQNIFPPAK